LNKLDNLRRDQRRVQLQQKKEAEESEGGSAIASESEEEEEDDDEGSEQEGSSYLDDTSSYQPSSATSSSPSQRSQSQSAALEDRLARIEALLMARELTGRQGSGRNAELVTEGRQQQDSIGRGQSTRQDNSRSAGQTEPLEADQHYFEQGPTVRFSTSPTRSYSDSVSRLPQGMLGCPELESREDLLVLQKFEVLEKKYADYVDRAHDQRRTPQSMAHCFRKYLPTIVMTLNSLLARDAAVRRKYSSVLASCSYTVSEDILKQWDVRMFSNVYKELCTAKTFMASEVITQLMDTKFARHAKKGQDPYTLTAFVMQATTAFQERLESLPTQTVKKCSDTQLRDTFIKMILGKDDRHLADFAHCYTWVEAAQAMFDLEGTGQGVNFLRQALQDHAPSSDAPRAGGGPAGRTDRPNERGPSERHGGRTNDHDDRGDARQDWSAILRRLSAEIAHTPRDLEGHTSDKDKVKRLMSLRDARKREKELQALESARAPPQRDHSREARSRGHSRDPGQGRRGESPPKNKDDQKGSHKSSAPPQAQEAGGGSAARTQSQLGPSGETRGTKCYNCHGFGHLARDCPKIGGTGGAAAAATPRSRDSSTSSRGRGGAA
jgi:hypothetical protein